MVNSLLTLYQILEKVTFKPDFFSFTPFITSSSPEFNTIFYKNIFRKQ